MNRNVEMIRSEGFRIVSKIPSFIRKELMLAVRNGELGHLKKDRLLPEVFFHPDYRDAAQNEQTRRALLSINSIKKVVSNE